MKKKIVVYGGAFDPPHLGHAAVIQIVLEFLSDPTHRNVYGASEIWVIPSADRRDKKVGTDGEHRLKMLESMIKEEFLNQKIPVAISDMEVKRSRPTVTYETKIELEKIYPDYEFWFLVGSDSLDNIEKIWVNGAKLYQEANFLVVGRPGYKLPEKLPPSYVYLGDSSSAKDVSSTIVRERLKNGADVSDCLAPGVLDYIRTNNLYK